MTDRSTPARPDHADHDADLVAAYASGEVDDVVDERRAAEWIERCPDCQAEFEMQNAVADLLARSPLDPLTDSERHWLASGVALALDAETAPVIDLAARRQRRWIVTASVAAVSLAAFIGIGTVLSNDAGDLATVAAESDATESESVPEAAMELRSLEETEGAAAEAAAATTETASDEAAAPVDDAADGAEAAGTESAATADTDAIREDLPDDQSPESLAAFLAARVETVRRRSPLEPVDLARFSDTESPTPPCLTDDTTDLHLVIETTLEGDPVVAFITGPDAESLVATVYDGQTCEVIPLPE